MGKDVIVACDFDSAEKTFEFLEQIHGEKAFHKDRNGAVFFGDSRNSQRYKEERP